MFYIILIMPLTKKTLILNKIHYIFTFIIKIINNHFQSYLYYAPYYLSLQHLQERITAKSSNILHSILYRFSLYHNIIYIPLSLLVLLILQCHLYCDINNILDATIISPFPWAFRFRYTCINIYKNNLFISIINLH